MNATAGSRGYIVHCPAGNCFGGGWLLAGGTSAGAPLLAGIVADANQYSRAHGGQRLGFANPFLYRMFANHPAVFRDITRGDNGPGREPRYPATRGYDLATGIGSVSAEQLALHLAAAPPSNPSPDPTTLTAAPTGPRTVSYGTPIDFHGRLTDGGGGVAGARVYLQGLDSLGYRSWSDVTDAQGNWSITLAGQLTRKTRWRVSYLGSETREPALVLGSTIYIIPRIGISADLPVVAGRLTAHAGRVFTLRGLTRPNMAGRTLVAYRRRVGATTWVAMAPDTVGPAGRLARAVAIPTSGLYQVRWRFRGGLGGQWVSSSSPAIGIRVLGG
jgi:hypothetical protein